jgi:hypothetical protein
MRPSATSVRGLKLLLYEALRRLTGVSMALRQVLGDPLSSFKALFRLLSDSFKSLLRLF